MIASRTTDIPSQIQRANQLLEKGQQDSAQLIFDQLAQEEITDTHTLAQFGELAFRLGEKVRAINALSKAVESSPENAAYLDLYAQVLIDIHNYSKSTKLLEKAIHLNPDFHLPYIRLASIYLETYNFQQAIPLLEKAISLKPGEPLTYVYYINALRYTDRHEDALKYAQKLLRLTPNNPANHEILARVLIELGKLDDARAQLEKTLRIDPTYGPAYNSLTDITKFTPESEAIIRQAEAALKLPMRVENRALILFSLGKTYDDCKQWDKAFEHYRQANLLSKPAIEDSTAAAVKRFKKTRKTYNKKFIANTTHLGSDSEIPVFVVGMPRSGTTLIEQIISSHSQGAGAGELTAIDQIEKTICPDESLSDYDKLLRASLTKELIHKHARDYLEVLTKNHTNTNRIVDKMPDNFLYLGLINLLFPNAHIIHAIRNPLDTCLSCYLQPFTYIKWSHDLDWIAARYHMYREFMDYWKEVLPENKIIHMHYEDIIDNPETQIRGLISACDMPWEDQCLQFHKKERAITTASVWQARQPIYQSSRMRWVHYAPFLKALANKLSHFLSDEDFAEFERQGIRIKKKWRLGFRR